MTLDSTVNVLSRGKDRPAQRQGAGWRQLATNNNRILCVPVPISRSSKAVECGWEEAGEGAWRPGPTSADEGGSVEWERLVGSKQSHRQPQQAGGCPGWGVRTDPGGWLLGSASRTAASPLWLPFLPRREAWVGIGA